MDRYYSMHAGGEVTDLYIYGDIHESGDNDAEPLVRRLDASASGLVRVYINSYGGEADQAFAIYNALLRRKAAGVPVETWCDGYACSAAFLIFMAGGRRLMGKCAMLLAHKAWTVTLGNADELRTEADVLDKLDAGIVAAVMAGTGKDEATVRGEVIRGTDVWMNTAEALSLGYATEAAPEPVSGNRLAAQARESALALLTARTSPPAQGATQQGLRSGKIMSATNNLRKAGLLNG